MAAGAVPPPSSYGTKTMHDGYLFTLGICGSAAAGQPALRLLDAMLAALPPVKRAVYLGEVLPIAADGTLQDPLLEPLLADMADAEILLLSTPAPPNGLPLRLRRMLEYLPALQQAGRLAPQQIVAVTVGPAADAAIHQLRQTCAALTCTLRDVALDESAIEQAATQDRVVELARAAYRAVRRSAPDALPYENA